MTRFSRTAGKSYAVRPVLGAVFDAPVELIALEGLERDGGVAEIFVAEGLEIACADDDIEILAPIVVDLFVNQCTTRHEVLQTVRSGAERGLERCLRDVALAARFVRSFPPVFRQHRKLADNLRQLTVARPVEGKFDFALADLLDFHDMPVIGAVETDCSFSRHRMRKERHRP